MEHKHTRAHTHTFFGRKKCRSVVFVILSDVVDIFLWTLYDWESVVHWTRCDIGFLCICVCSYLCQWVLFYTNKIVVLFFSILFSFGDEWYVLVWFRCQKISHFWLSIEWFNWKIEIFCFNIVLWSNFVGVCMRAYADARFRSFLSLSLSFIHFSLAELSIDRLLVVFHIIRVFFIHIWIQNRQIYFWCHWQWKSYFYYTLFDVHSIRNEKEICIAKESEPNSKEYIDFNSMQHPL